MTMRKIHEHYPGALEQTVAGLIQLAAEEACMGKSPLPTYMVLADLAEEYGLTLLCKTWPDSYLIYAESED